MNRRIFVFPFLLACSSRNETQATQAALRPGVKDSSQAYMGTPSKSEIALWESVRHADAVARQGAMAALKSDLTNDPTNAYSAFLAGSTPFIQGSDLLLGMAAGQPLSR